MWGKILAGSVLGINAYLVEVEVDIRFGLPAFNIVGLPESAVRESKERVYSAIKNTNFSIDSQKITVNLAPADIKKEGTLFDLPIALGVLSGFNFISKENIKDFLIVGELSLDGSLKPVKGILPIAILVKELGLKGIILPEENSKEASVVEGINVYAAKNLKEVVDFLNGEINLKKVALNFNDIFKNDYHYCVDFSDIYGQAHVKRALEVAAAGSHNVLLIGPPGSGKTLLAKAIPSILPDLTFEEALETSKIYSVMGLLKGNGALITKRTFCSPHHTASDVAIIGGGRNAKCGQVSLAHNGVLFLDELPEFRRNVLEALRQPLEDKKVTVSRIHTTVTYPANFMLVASMNPCPCGFLTDNLKKCECSALQIQRYKSKISGPLLDRIDIQIEVPSINFSQIVNSKGEESSESIRKRVNFARAIQVKRFKNSGIHCNSQMEQREIKLFCSIDNEGKNLLEKAMTKLGLSARAYSRILKVARTIADLSNSSDIKCEHIAEAIQYRSLDRDYRYPRF